MNLEKAQKIKKLCDEIAEIEQEIKELEDCSYIDINIVKPFADPKIVKTYKSSNIYSHILQAYKEDRNSLITELDLM